MTAIRAEDLGPTAGPPPQDTEDKALTVAFKSGDRGAYDAIYSRHSQRVHGICRRMLGDPDDAQEATQETFLRVYQALGRFNGRYQLGAWIARIATNVCLDTLRSRSRKPSQATPSEILELDPAQTNTEIDPEFIYIRNLEGRRVRRVLGSLPPMHRAAIVLRDFEGLSYEEIAIALSITDCQVKALIHRARKGFKRSWPTEVASIVLPWRLIRRLRTVAEESPDKVSHGGQVAQVASSPAANVAASCSGILQQCGQVLTERAVGAFTVLAVGAGATAAAGVHTIVERHPEEVISAAVAESDASPGVVRERPRLDKHSLVSHPEKSSEEPAVTDPAPPPSDPAPEPEPAPVPEPAPEPSPVPTQPADPKPSPAPSPTPIPPEPKGYTMGFDVALAGSGETCDCLLPNEVKSESLTVSDGRGLERFQQSLSGSASAAGTPSYGLTVTHGSTAPSEHVADISLRKKGGLYRYSAEGALVDRSRTEWGGWVYMYEGTYSLSSYPENDPTMPKSGSYVVKVVASWRQGRIVETIFSLN